MSIPAARTQVPDFFAATLAIGHPQADSPATPGCFPRGFDGRIGLPPAGSGRADASRW